MFNIQNNQKKQDLRKFKPQVPIQPSKGQKKTTRPFTRDSNLTDLLGTDIFGGNAIANDKIQRKPSSSNNYLQRKSSIKDFPG